MGVKYIVESVIVLVIALFIFSYFFNPDVKYQTKEYMSNLKNKLSSNVEKIPTPEKLNCKEKASELVPKYLIFSKIKKLQLPNYWKNGDGVNFDVKDESILTYENECFRKGTEEGENINYYYLSHEEDCPISFSYSKKIINQDIVKGTNSFKIVPVLKESELKFDMSIDSSNNFRISWEGFNDEIKKLLNVDEFTVEIFTGDKYDKNIILKKSYNDEEGNETFEVNDRINNLQELYGHIDVLGWYVLTPAYIYSPSLLMTITPDINMNKVYEIVDFDISDCNWID